MQVTIDLQAPLSDATYLGRALIPALKGRAKFKPTLRVEDIVSAYFGNSPESIPGMIRKAFL